MLWWTLRQLESKDPATRQRAAEELAKAKEAKVIDVLVPLLQDPHSGVRKAAAQSLSALGWQPAADSDRARHAVALQEWDRAVAIGVPAVEPLIALLTDENWAVMRAASTALGQIGDMSAVEPLAQADGCTLKVTFASPAERRSGKAPPWRPTLDPLTRVAICTALGNILAQHRDVQVDYRVLEHLFNNGLERSQPEVQRASIAALAAARTPLAVEYLVKSLLWDLRMEGGTEIADLLADILASMEPSLVRPALDPLYRALKDTHAVEHTEQYRVDTGDDRFYEDRLKVWTSYPLREGAQKALLRITGQDSAGKDPPKGVA